MTGFINIAGASSLLSRSPRWVRGQLSWLPHFRVNSQILFREDELLKAMERFRQPVEEIDLGGLLDRVAPSRRNRRRPSGGATG